MYYAGAEEYSTHALWVLQVTKHIILSCYVQSYAI